MSECRCQHCDRIIAFEPDRAGESIACPYCLLDTQLFLPPEATSPPMPARRVEVDFWRVAKIISVVVLVALLVTVAVFVVKYWGAVLDLFVLAPSLLVGLGVLVLLLFALWLAVMWLFFPILVIQRLDRLIAAVKARK